MTADTNAVLQTGSLPSPAGSSLPRLEPAAVALSTPTDNESLRHSVLALLHLVAALQGHMFSPDARYLAYRSAAAAAVAAGVPLATVEDVLGRAKGLGKKEREGSPLASLY